MCAAVDMHYGMLIQSVLSSELGHPRLPHLIAQHNGGPVSIHSVVSEHDSRGLDLQMCGRVRVCTSG